MIYYTAGTLKNRAQVTNPHLDQTECESFSNGEKTTNSVLFERVDFSARQYSSTSFLHSSLATSPKHLWPRRLPPPTPSGSIQITHRLAAQVPSMANQSAAIAAPLPSRAALSICLRAYMIVRALVHAWRGSRWESAPHNPPHPPVSAPEHITGGAHHARPIM